MADGELLKELEDDLRHERWERAWRSFGSAMVGLSVLVVLGTIGIVAWQHHARTARMQQTGLLLQGLERLSLEDTQGALNIFNNFPAAAGEDIAALAALRRAGLLAQTKQPTQALAVYADVAGRQGVDRFWRDLAALLALNLQRQYGLESLVKAEPPQPGAPLFFTATEQYALHKLAAGKREEALASLSDLRENPLSPASLRGRTGEMITVLAPEKAAVMPPVSEE